MFKVLFLSKIYPACHLDVNGIKPGSNSIMTDKHTTEHSKIESLCIYWPVCDVYIAHTTIFLSRKLILLAILLHGQFIHYTQISLHPTIHFFNAQQRAYQSFLRNFLV